MTTFRNDFPIFTTHPDLIYLDSAATSQKPQSVIDAVTNYLSTTNSNIHRGVYQIAEQSEDLYRKSKSRFAQMIGWSSETEVIYHYSATACYNLLAQSLIKSEILTPGDSIILGVSEHHANIVPRQMIAEQHNLQIRRLPLDDNYTLDRSALPSLIDDRTKVISLSAFSNVTGDMPNFSQIRKIVGDDIFFCIDASQILGKYPINVSTLRADALIGTAHKMLGLTGLGMLRIQEKRINKLQPARWGGWAIKQVTREWYILQSDIHGREAGTPHVVGAVSLLAAMDYISGIGWVHIIADHDQTLTAYALERLKTIPWLSIIGQNINTFVPFDHSAPTHRRWGVISFTLDKVTKNHLAQHCANQQIAIRCGWHCTFPLRQDLGQTGWCRISFHIYNTTHDIDSFIHVLQKIQ